MPAHDDVHLRLVEHVAHVQAAGDVRRRKQQSEDRPLLARRRRRREKSFSSIQYSAQRVSIAPGS